MSDIDGLGHENKPQEKRSNDKQFSITLNDKQNEQLESLASDLGLSKSQAMRYAIKLMNVILQERDPVTETVTVGDKKFVI